MDTRCWELLRSKVESTAGGKITTFSCCQRLEYLMKLKGFYISAHTLARFWGIICSKGRFYASTLEALSQYAGYQDYSSFQAENAAKHLTVYSPIVIPNIPTVICFELFGAYLLLGMKDGSVVVWCLQSDIIVQRFIFSTYPIVSIAASTTHLVCADENGDFYKALLG